MRFLGHHLVPRDHHRHLQPGHVQRLPPHEIVDPRCRPKARFESPPRRSRL